jgi:DNA-binding XRE family transcriptional regulator
MKSKQTVEKKLETLARMACANVRAIRNRRGYTQEKLGELTGYGRIRIVEIESRRYCPTLPTLNTLACALGVEVVDLLVPQADASYD